MDKIITIEDREFEKPGWITDMGNFNKMPKPFVEVEEDDYIYVASNSCLEFMEYRQVMDLEDNKLSMMRIEYFHNCAFAITRPSDWHLLNGKIKYKDRPRYFKIGCEHKYVELDQDECRKLNILHGGNCYHVYKCSECGHVYAIDSSG